ncbi:MAG TPA: FxLYD domain-containing protein [Methylomirabilota bacterium]|jgi:hypothetical protein|nr:FxLYD domain-containing protein [Methylomirabilota bacterium]
MPSGRGSLGTVRITSGCLTAALVGLLLAGCGSSSSSSGPTIDAANVDIQNETLVPAGQACHVRGTAVNATADTTVEVAMRWQAFDAADRAIGTTKFIIPQLPPGGRQDFESTGFASNDRGLIPCSAVTRFERIETTVNSH